MVHGNASETKSASFSILVLLVHESDLLYGRVEK